MASDDGAGVRRWSLTDVVALEAIWPGARFRAIGHGPFTAHVVRRSLTSVVIEGISATPYAVHRGSREILAEPRDDLMLHAVVEGSGTVTRGDERIDVRAGDLFFLRVGSPFEYRCPVRTRTFRASVAESLLPARLRHVYSPMLSVLEPSAVARAFLLLAQDLLTHEKDLAVSSASSAHLDAAMVALEHGAIAEELAVRPQAGQAESELRKAVLDYIEAHLSEPALGPRLLADAHRISLRSLHKLFEALPETAAERIRRRRVEEAAATLRLRDVGTAELADSLGFTSRDSFQRTFRQYQGVTPAEYRALRLGIAAPDR